MNCDSNPLNIYIRENIHKKDYVYSMFDMYTHMYVHTDTHVHMHTCQGECMDAPPQGEGAATTCP